jgi:ribose-phosphate pyrophosphokinase
MDVHSLSVFQSSFRMPTDHLEAKNLIADYVASNLKKTSKEISVLAPDSGGASRADRFRNTLSAKLDRKISLVHMDKIREGAIVHGSTISDDVEGKIVIALDDMISSGSTLAKCAETVKKCGGDFWGACATHGLFVGDVNSNLSKIKRVIVTDTIEHHTHLPAKVKAKLTILPTTRLFARAIRRTHDEGGSISDLLR